MSQPTPDPPTGTGAHDARLTLPPLDGALPAAGFLGRREFAVIPWLALSLTCFGMLASASVRAYQGRAEWLFAEAALAGALATLALGFIQDTSLGMRFRRDLRVYVLGAAVTLLCLAGAAVLDLGPASLIYTGALPLATYAGMVFPRRLWTPTVLTIIATTVATQLLSAGTPVFDGFIVGTLVLACWGSGALVNQLHARTVKIALRLSAYDRPSSSLNRRGIFEQLEYTLATSAADDRPIAFLLVELEPLGLRGRLDDDELLAWAGEVFPSALPEDAELGRTGTREFGVVLPGAGQAKAAAVAHSIRAYLHERCDATVGAATSQSGQVEAADLVRVADAALVTAHEELTGSHVLVAGSVRPVGSSGPQSAAVSLRRPLSYRSLRETGRLPRLVTVDTAFRRTVTLSILLLTAAGCVIIGRQIVEGGGGTAGRLMIYGGGFWVLWNLATATLAWRRYHLDDLVLNWVLIVNNGLALSVGLTVAALAAGGLTAPIAAAMYAKVLYDTVTMTRPRALASFGIIFAGWLTLAVLSPASTLWSIPFQLSMFGAALMLGTIGHQAIEQSGDQVREIATTDELTGLPDRDGFAGPAEDAFVEAATTTGFPFAIIALRIDGLRALNRSRGTGGADAAIRALADLICDRLPTAYVVGRTSASTFMVALAVENDGHARRLTSELGAAAGELLPVQTGLATCPSDGADVDALTAAALVRAGADGPATVIRSAA